MGDLPLPASSALFSPDGPTVTTDPEPPGSTESSENHALLDVLREALNDQSQSTESILHAVADAARILSSAQGTAIALRLDGTIVCRARSGEIGPELGSPLNIDSGISGECLRTATILVCSDADTDARVDPAVCRSLGVRSIAVVPLRGRMGMIGILEAFSSAPGAFDQARIDLLRTLAEIAESAYERERRMKAAALQSALTVRVLHFDAAPIFARKRQFVAAAERFFRKRYWLVIAVAVAVFVISLVVRLSWRQTGAEIAASTAPARTETRPTMAGPAAVNKAGNNSSASSPRVAAVQPASTAHTRASDHSRAADVLHKAAEIAPTKELPSTSTDVIEVSSGPTTSRASRPASSEVEPPPSVDLASATNSDLPPVTAESAPLPAFGGNVSQGITQASLLRRIEPLYPPQARIQGIAGPVTLDATIAADGSVRSVAVVSGPPLLAEAATTAVSQWRYRPATLNGKPIQAQKRITVVFKY